MEMEMRHITTDTSMTEFWSVSCSVHIFEDNYQCKTTSTYLPNCNIILKQPFTRPRIQSTQTNMKKKIKLKSEARFCSPNFGPFFPRPRESKIFKIWLLLYGPSTTDSWSQTRKNKVRIFHVFPLLLGLTLLRNQTHYPLPHTCRHTVMCIMLSHIKPAKKKEKKREK